MYFYFSIINSLITVRVAKHFTWNCNNDSNYQRKEFCNFHFVRDFMDRLIISFLIFYRKYQISNWWFNCLVTLHNILILINRSNLTLTSRLFTAGTHEQLTTFRNQDWIKVKWVLSQISPERMENCLHYFIHFDKRSLINRRFFYLIKDLQDFTYLIGTRRKRH